MKALAFVPSEAQLKHHHFTDKMHYKDGIVTITMPRCSWHFCLNFLAWGHSGAFNSPEGNQATFGALCVSVDHHHLKTNSACHRARLKMLRRWEEFGHLDQCIYSCIWELGTKDLDRGRPLAWWKDFPNITQPVGREVISLTSCGKTFLSMVCLKQLPSYLFWPHQAAVVVVVLHLGQAQHSCDFNAWPRRRGALVCWEVKPGVRCLDKTPPSEWCEMCVEFSG